MFNILDQRSGVKLEGINKRAEKFERRRNLDLGEVWGEVRRVEDTSREIRAIQQKIWMSFPEAERFRKCGEMFELAKAFAESRAPVGLSDDEKRRFVIREMYGLELPK
ncbi:MAG: hypothetical protein KF756_00215 [Acidobacteria bacterium]|nr:hypothetical protein [Acidobacteriota bacterium]